MRNGPERGNGDAERTDGDAGPTADGNRTMANVNHVHPDTKETFWAVYRRGPAMADGGSERSRGTDAVGREQARRNGASPDETASASEPTTDATATVDETTADGTTTETTMAEVSHEPPYPETNDLWARGTTRANDEELDV